MQEPLALGALSVVCAGGIYQLNDLSKQKSFLGSLTGVAHVLIGVALGALLVPRAYGDVPPLLLHLLGALGVCVFTIRNIWKHTRNLRRRMQQCEMANEYSPFYSSVLRQQLQLTLGVAIACLVLLWVLDPLPQDSAYYSWRCWPLYALLALVGIHTLLQYRVTRPHKIKQTQARFLQCVGKG